MQNLDIDACTRVLPSVHPSNDDCMVQYGLRNCKWEKKKKLVLHFALVFFSSFRLNLDLICRSGANDLLLAASFSNTLYGYTQKLKKKKTFSSHTIYKWLLDKVMENCIQRERKRLKWLDDYKHCKKKSNMVKSSILCISLTLAHHLKNENPHQEPVLLLLRLLLLLLQHKTAIKMRWVW